MEPQHPRRWRAWALAGLLAFGVGGLTARPAPAKPGFGTVSDDDRAKQKAEQEKRAEERRQQGAPPRSGGPAREADRQADRDRQAQERARQEQQQESQRRTQREQAERDRTARDTQRERDTQARAERERTAREVQARAERERAAREAQARTDRERAAREAQARNERERADREGQTRASREREAQEVAAREARARDEQRRAATPSPLRGGGTARRAVGGVSREPERPRPGFGRRPTEEPRRDLQPSTPQPAREPRDRTPESPTESQPARPQPGFGRRSETHRPAGAPRAEETRSQPPPTTPGASAVNEPRDRTPDRQGESSPARRRPGFGTRSETTHSQPSGHSGPGGLPEGQAVRLRSPVAAIPGLREDRGEPDRRGSRANRPPETAKGDGRRQKIPFGVRRSSQTTRNGSLDRYFNPRGGDIGYHLGDDRDRHRRGQIAYRHDRRYHHYQRYDCPYDVIYVPPPVVFYEPPRTDVVVIPVPERLPERDDVEEPRYREPEPEPERPESPSRLLARASTLDEVIGDVEDAWLTGNLQLLMQHVREDHPLEVYREGEFTSALSWEQFREKTREAFERYETLAMRFAAPRMLSDTEAVVSAEHRYREAGGKEQRVRVVYALTKERGAWWIAGLDYLLLERPEPRPQPRPAVARPRAAAPALSQVTLVKARPIRWASLRSQAHPTLLATLRGVSGGRASLYDLKAMRGIHPGTLAWALYRRGQTRPRETGILEPRSLPAAAWVTVKLGRRPASPTTTMARLTAPGRPDPTLFPIRTLGGIMRLTLAEVQPPKRSTPGIKR
jgi:hypothetical protein